MEGRQLAGIFKKQLDRCVVSEQRLEHALQRAEQLVYLELLRADPDLSRLHLGQIEQIVDHLLQIARRAFDKAHLLHLLGCQIAVQPIHQQPCQRDDRVQRRTEFVRDVGEEFGFQLRGPAQIVRALVQLRVQCHDTPVGVFQFAVQQLQLFLASAQLLQRLEQLLVLLLDLLIRAFRRPLLQFPVQLANRTRGHEGVVGRKMLDHPHRGPQWLALDLEAVHQPPGTEQPDAHAGGRFIPPIEDLLEIRDAGSGIGNRHFQELRISQPDRELHFAVAGVAEGVAGNLRGCGRHADLVLVVQTELRGNFPGSLPCLDDIALGAQSKVENRNRRHGYAAFTTTTLASSRSRRKSRIRVPPITAGWRAMRPA